MTIPFPRVVCTALLLATTLTRAGADDTRQLSLPTNDIVFDPVSQRIYASVPSRAGSNGNSITVVNPELGTIGPSVFIGSEPGKLAVSGDGQFLYVALAGSAAIR